MRIRSAASIFVSHAPLGPVTGTALRLRIVKAWLISHATDAGPVSPSELPYEVTL